MFSNMGANNGFREFFLSRAPNHHERVKWTQNIHKKSIKHPLKEHRCKLKTDELTYSKHSVGQPIALPKMSFQCILKQ